MISQTISFQIVFAEGSVNQQATEQVQSAPEPIVSSEQAPSAPESSELNPQLISESNLLSGIQQQIEQFVVPQGQQDIQVQTETQTEQPDVSAQPESPVPPDEPIPSDNPDNLGQPEIIWQESKGKTPPHPYTLLLQGICIAIRIR